MEARGSVFKYGDNIDTDVIIPARYLNTQNARELADHCMEDIDKTFITRGQAGDIMVGGENFGCGSSREHAPLAIKSAGIACVIAASFARIFYRNAIIIGVPMIIAGIVCGGLYSQMKTARLKTEANDYIGAGLKLRVQVDNYTHTDRVQVYDPPHEESSSSGGSSVDSDGFGGSSGGSF